MCGNYFNLNAKKDNEPVQPPVRGYHVHIYFEAGKTSEQTAQLVAEKIGARFPDAVKDIHEVGAGNGPHTAPNFGVSITPESFGEVVSWLQRNSKGLSILVHPRTGDEQADHLDSALWLGKPVELSQAFFDQLKPKGSKGPMR